jgi:1-phosphofructokinase family hexose kinase
MFLTICLNPTFQKTLRFNSIIPGAVNRTAAHRLDASGKGINVTRVLAQLGKKAVHLTQLGGSLRPLFLSLCEQDGLSVEWTESNSQIRFCYTLLTENVTELVEESEPVIAGTEELILAKFDTLLASGTGSDSSLFTPHCLIISGKKAEGFSDKVYPYMVSKAKEKGVKIILDIRGNDLIECLKYEPDIVKPNMEEFAATFNLGVNETGFKKDLHSLIMEITQKYNCRIILTNGSKNVLAADKNNFFEVDVPAVKAVNSIGCGDAFTAGLAVAFENGADFNAAISEGIRCGALNAGFEKPGVIR